MGLRGHGSSSEVISIGPAAGTAYASMRIVRVDPAGNRRLGIGKYYVKANFTIFCQEQAGMVSSVGAKAREPI